MWIDWDSVFNLRVWQIVKWLFGTFVLVLIVTLLWYSQKYKSKWEAQVKANEWEVAVLQKILYDTKANDSTILLLLYKYIEGRTKE